MIVIMTIPLSVVIMNSFYDDDNDDESDDDEDADLGDKHDSSVEGGPLPETIFLKHFL